MIPSVRLYSQESYTKELRWLSCDSIVMPVFQNTNQIIEWGKSIGPSITVQSEKISIENNDVFILKVDKCFGIYCPSIYIFKKDEKLWKLIANTNAQLKERIEICVDSSKKKLVFYTGSIQIGELTFE